jgi:hypothetical protein
MISRCLTLALLTACTPRPIKSPTTIPQGQAAAPRPAAPLPGGPDISDQTMGFLVVSDGARVAQELNPNIDARASTVELAKTFGFDTDVAAVIDLKRPLGLAMLNPSLLSSATVRPYVAMLPVTSPDEVLRMLAKKAPIQKTPWGALWKTPVGEIAIGFEGGYAVIAWRKDLLGPTVKLLAPRLEERVEAPVRVHLDLANMLTSYGPQIESLIARFAIAAASGGKPGDPALSYGLRQVRTLVPYLESFSGLDLYADLDSGGLTLSVGLEGKPGGAWAHYVGQQRSGPAWGVRFLPKDAVLAYTTQSSPMSRKNDLDALVDYMGSMSVGDRVKWRNALAAAVGTTDGQLAYAVWPARGGGVGMGGAYRLSDPGGARDAMNRAYTEVAVPLTSVVLRGLALDPARFAKRVQVQRKRARIGGVDADLIEVNVKWPAGSDGQRRAFEAMFGPRLVMATAYLGDEALFVLGADYAERLTTMIQVAQGQGAASLGDEPAFAEALSFRDRDRVSLTYLDTARMAHFAASLMVQTRDLGAREQATVSTLLQQVGRGAIVSTTNASGSRYQLTTHLPPGAVAGAAQLHGALWRIALSPLLNPPMMPPMPVPPPHVAPSVHENGAPM